MQKDQIVGMDLTADSTEATPTVNANVACLAIDPPSTGTDLDLTGEVPGPFVVRRCVDRESATLGFVLRVWKALHVSLLYEVHGPISWPPTLCALVLVNAILAASAVPSLILHPTASAGLHVAVAAVAGFAVLIAGGGILLYWLRKKS